MDRFNKMEHYVVVLGECKFPERQEKMVRRLKEIGGEVNKVFDNLYILSMSHAKLQTNEIIGRISGEEKYEGMVIRYRDALRAYWCIPSEKKSFMDNLFISQHFDEKDR